MADAREDELLAELADARQMIADLRYLLAERCQEQGLTPEILDRALSLGIETGRAMTAPAPDMERLVEAVALVRRTLNTKRNGGTGWMHEFETLVQAWEKAND